MVKPLAGQLEQLSNAKALEDLGIAKSMNALDRDTTRSWLDNFSGKSITYPDVAKSIAHWISEKGWERPESKEMLVQSLWKSVKTDAGSKLCFNKPPVAQLASA